MTNKERQVTDNEVNYLGPLAIAQFIDIGWMTQWPLCWSRNRFRAVLNGYGLWAGDQQRLPYVTEPDREDGAIYWPSRATRLPRPFAQTPKPKRRRRTPTET